MMCSDCKLTMVQVGKFMYDYCRLFPVRGFFLAMFDFPPVKKRMIEKHTFEQIL